jgi:hypothetical protein
MVIIYFAAGFIGYCFISHFISYTILKKRILEKQKWDLNICCGNTDGGGINADIVKHKEVPNFRLVEDIYNLPFKTGEFRKVICSHTIEHVDDPKRFFMELKRVGEEVTLVIPPLYDITAAFNFFEHKTIFFSFKKVHRKLPPHTRLPLAKFIHKKIGQNIEASAIPLATIFSRLRKKKPGKK